MGNDNSKVAAAEARLDAERASHWESLANHEKQVKMLQKLIADGQDYHQTQMNEIRADREKIRKDYERNYADKEKATSEERERMRKEYIRMCEENDKAAAKAREDQKEEERKLIKKYEKDKKNIEAKLDTERDKRLEDKKIHSEKVETLHSEMRELAEAKNQEIRALQGNNEYLRIAGIVAQHQYAANSIAMLNNLAINNAGADDSNRLKNEKQAILGAISDLEALRKKVVEWKTDVEIGTVSEMDKTAQTILQSMAENAKLLGNKINAAIYLVDEASFGRDLIEEAKRHLNVALNLADTLYTEIAAVRVKIVKTPLDFSLAKTEEYLKGLRQAINSIPSRITPTMNECIQQNMARVAIQSRQDIANLVNNSNAISSGIETIPSLEPP